MIFQQSRYRKNYGQDFTTPLKSWTVPTVSLPLKTNSRFNLQENTDGSNFLKNRFCYLFQKHKLLFLKLLMLVWWVVRVTDSVASHTEPLTSPWPSYFVSSRVFFIVCPPLYQSNHCYSSCLKKSQRESSTSKELRLMFIYLCCI